VDDEQGQAEQSLTEHRLDQVREALLDVSDSVAGAAQGAYDQGSRYVRQARAHYPEAQQYIRQSQRAVTHRVTQNPLLARFTAGVASYVLAWMIQGQWRDQDTRVPDYGRTSREYAPHREH
jgi:hypothetical protein